MKYISAKPILRFLPPLIILAAAAAIGFDDSLRNQVGSIWQDFVISHFSGAEAASNPSGETCTAPCCSKKTEKVAAPASDEKAAPCCASCASKAAGVDTPKASCCTGDTCTSHGEASAQTNRIVWTNALIEDYKSHNDWCAAHAVPESMCIHCNSALIEGFKARGDWCSTHEVPASLCSICRKELVQLGIGRDWCEKHGLPASQCVQCNPSRSANGILPQPLIEEAKLEVTSHFEDETAKNIQEALSNGKTNDQGDRSGINPNCPLHHIRIQLKSADVVGEAGLEMVPITPRSLSRTIECYGNIEYDQSRYALLSPRSSGIIHSVDAELGQQISKGDILALIDSSDFGKAKADFLRSIATLNRCQWMVESFESGTPGGGVARKEMVEARANLDSAEIELAIARQTLKNFGLNDEELDRVAASRDTSTLLPVRAPFDGTIVERQAVSGELVETGKALFSLADISRMWLCLDLFAEDLTAVEVGMPIAFKVDGSRSDLIRGNIAWISSELDPQTRTGQVRAELDNSDQSLRAGLFGRGNIVLHRDEQVLAVPSEAVQWDGCCNVVFVERGHETFEPRKVRLGYEQDGFILVKAGLLEGERVVTRGSYLMKTEILKDSIGAGCCADHASTAPKSTESPSAETSHVKAAADSTDEAGNVSPDEFAHAAH